MGGDRDHNGGSVAAAPDGPIRLLVVLRAANMDRITEGFLRCALDQGHTVHVALENRKDKAGRATNESLFDAFVGEYADFTYETLEPREDLWLHSAARLRRAIDYLRYFAPEFRTAGTLRSRAASRAPWYVRAPGALGFFRIGPLRRLADRSLRGLERRMPISQQSVDLLHRIGPDVLVVSPLIETGSPQGDHLRAADSLGIPTVLVVASWDNLTTKGVIRDRPDTTIVWNADQVREAVELHGLTPETVVATGAHSHDHWFSWAPSTASAEFAQKVGLEPTHPFVLYTCSSGFIAGDDEVAFAREWAQRLRASGDPDLASLGVLVRPHPQNHRSWLDAELAEPGRIAVWPQGGVAPTDEQSKNDYFDSLHHAKAVVGINTSALIDSAIVGRPVFTIVLERFRNTQSGTLHFSYLARDDGRGLLNVAHSWDEHFEQLGHALRSDGAHREQIEEFLRAFIRPHGLDQAAAPHAMRAIADTANREKEPSAPAGAGRSVVGATASGLGRLHRLVRIVRPRALRRRATRWLRQRRRRRAEKRVPRQAKAERAALKAEVVARRADKQRSKTPK